MHGVLVERGGNYADIADNSVVFTQLMEAIGVEKPGNMDPAIFHCISNIMTKFARAASGNPYHEDTWTDIANYSVLILACIRRQKADTLDSIEATKRGG